MKKLFLLFVVCTGFGICAAQHLGVQAGGNLSRTTGAIASTAVKFNGGSTTGFEGGLVAVCKLSGSLALRPELEFIQKGGNTKITSAAGLTMKLNYAELPINLIYTSRSGKIFFGAGSYLAYGLGGKYNMTGTGSGWCYIKFDRKPNSTSADSYLHLKPLDYGATTVVGYKFTENFLMTAGADFGFANIYPESGGVLKNGNGFALRVGYMFYETKAHGRQ